MKTRKEKEAFWSRHIKLWRKSGLTQTLYCNQENLKPHQFTYWKSIADNTTTSTGKPNSGFAAVSVLPATSKDLTLSFPSGVQLSGINASNFEIAQKMMEMVK